MVQLPGKLGGLGFWGGGGQRLPRFDASLEVQDIAIFARFNVVLLLRGIFTAVKANKDQVEPDVLQGQS